jgi:hypothetical protein
MASSKGTLRDDEVHIIMIESSIVCWTPTSHGKSSVTFAYQGRGRDRVDEELIEKYAVPCINLYHHL